MALGHQRSLKRFALEWGMAIYGATLWANYGTDVMLKKLGEKRTQKILYSDYSGKTRSCEFRKMVIDPTNEVGTPIDPAYSPGGNSISPFNPNYFWIKSAIYLENSIKFDRYQRKRSIDDDCGCGKILPPTELPNGVLIA